MTAATRNRIRLERDLRVRDQVGFGNTPSTDPKLDRVVWLPSATKPAVPSVFRAYREYEGRLAA